MRKNIIILGFLFFMVGLTVQPGLAGNRKLAQTGMKFLVVAPDARSSALSSALTAMEGTSASLFYNPAGMARMAPTFQASLGRVKWIADINYLYGSMAYKPAGGMYGVFGISFLSIDYGDFLGTIRADNSQGFIDTGIFQPTAYTFGLGYAKALTDKFSVGGQVKYVKQNLTGGIISFDAGETPEAKEFDLGVLAYDFGVLYKTGYKSLSLGMNVRNFSQEIKYIRESFQLPLTFRMGMAMNMMDFFPGESSDHSLFLSFDYVHPRDYNEQLEFGLEYEFMRTVALRLGYTTPTDEEGINIGAGLNKELMGLNFGIDYAYTPFGVFDSVHRISVQFSF